MEATQMSAEGSSFEEHAARACNGVASLPGQPSAEDESAEEFSGMLREGRSEGARQASSR